MSFMYLVCCRDDAADQGQTRRGHDDQLHCEILGVPGRYVARFGFRALIEACADVQDDEHDVCSISRESEVLHCSFTEPAQWFLLSSPRP